MKKLKTILILSLLTIGMVSVNAQENVQEIAQGIRWGVKGGLNVSNVTDLDADYRAGFNVGVMGQYMISPALGVEAGLFYSMQGYKKDILAVQKELVSKTMTASYLKLPIQAIYKFNVGQNLYLYPAAGLYFAYGMGGSSTDRVDAAGVVRKDGYFDDAQRFDMGLALGLNVQFERYIIGIGYDYGFLKVIHSGSHNSNVMVNVGYLF